MKKLFYLFLLVFSVSISFGQNSNRFVKSFEKADSAFNAQQKFSENYCITNHKAIPAIYNNFIDGCKYAGVDYQSRVKTLKSIRLINADHNFIGAVRGNEIVINRELERYPNLLQIVVFRQLGKYFGLKSDTSSKLTVMSERWEVTPEFEYYASNLRSRPFLRQHFFENLRKEHPLAKIL